jgi:hypothetical protein
MFWRDPHHRELILAAAAGAVWALVGIAVAARGAPTSKSAPVPFPLKGGVGRAEAAGPRAATASPSCRIFNHLPGGSTDIGSGTLIGVTADGSRGLVLSCGHLFSDGRGKVVVEFPGGRTHGANLVALDRDADLSALEIASPPGLPAQVAFDLDAGRTLTACGYGPSGDYRCVAGRVVGTATNAGQETLQIAGAVRSGDSGGGVFDERGRLVAVVWGESGGVTYATSGGPLRRFVERLRGRQRAAAVVDCPTGMCPRVAPAGPGVTPGAGQAAALGNADGLFTPGRAQTPDAGASDSRPCHCGGACGTQLAAIAARLDALAEGKLDRGDSLDQSALASLARTDQLALLERESRARHAWLVERLEALGVLISATGKAVGPIATSALGISGPSGWALLAATSLGGWLLGRRIKARAAGREARRKKVAELAPRASQLAPPEATAAAEAAFRTTSETHAPIERDDREARELLRLSQLEGRDPLQDALAGRLALDRLDAVADGDADPQRARLADELRRELRERFNDIAPTKFELSDAHVKCRA